VEETTGQNPDRLPCERATQKAHRRSLVRCEDLVARAASDAGREGDYSGPQPPFRWQRVDLSDRAPISRDDVAHTALPTVDAQAQARAAGSRRIAAPATPNSGVGLLPLSDAGMSGSGGIRGQAGLPLQYSDNECATSVARAQVVMPSGSLSSEFRLFGSTFPGCQPPRVSVNPFQPAEAAA